MKILAAGGGSGGHVTPAVAVLREIRQAHPRAKVEFWCDRKFAEQAGRLVAQLDPTIPVRAVASGKLRRYHHLTIWQQLANFRTIVLPNLWDMAKVVAGTVQSFVKLLVYRPDVIFMKGGFVCLPIGLAARVLHIPYVLHDSDAHPGLTNRILARWAVAIGTGAPLKFYNYPASKAQYVGVPVAAEFRPFTASQQRVAKDRLGFDPDRPLITITGGGLGAKRLNDVIAQCLPGLLKHTNVILISGAGQYDELRAITPQADPRFQLHAFISQGMAEMLGASDIVIARAGATTILELAALAKPTVLVPNARLTGGHQVKNAAVYIESGAAELLVEDEIEQDPQRVVALVKELLADPERTQQMGKAFHGYARPNAATDMAQMVLAARKK